MEKQKNQPFKLKLITNVADFGLLQPLARTRGRLIASTLAVAGLYYGGSLWVADFINNISTSVSLNMVLITFVMLALLLVSYITAMLVGDLFFPGQWRERVLLGKKPRLNADSPDAVDPSVHRDFNLHFLLVVAIAIAGNYLGMESLTNDFIEEYHDMGFHLTRLRSDDDAEKVKALKEVSKSIYAERWHEKRVSGAIIDELSNPEEEVQLWAMYATRQATLIGAYDRLKTMLGEGSPKKRGEAALTLGKLSDRRATPHLIAFLKASRGTEVQVVGALRGLTVLADTDAGPAIAAFTQDDSALVRSHAYWALGKLKHDAIYDEIKGVFEKSVGTDRCGPLVYLLYNAREKDIPHFKDLFVTTTEDTVCPYVIWEEYNEDKIYVIFKESLRAKYMKFIANAVGQKERDWFVFIASDKERPYELRRLASDIIREIDRR